MSITKFKKCNYWPVHTDKDYIDNISLSKDLLRVHILYTGLKNQLYNNKRFLVCLLNSTNNE